jgi:hypothetical protein
VNCNLAPNRLRFQRQRDQKELPHDAFASEIPEAVQQRFPFTVFAGMWYVKEAVTREERNSVAASVV